MRRDASPATRPTALSALEPSTVRVAIDPEVCFRHQRCSAHCPEVFGVDEEGYGVVLLPDVPAELESRVQECIDYCPEQAITASG
jgi:ferredoxin